jgi:hypothetical protein
LAVTDDVELVPPPSITDVRRLSATLTRIEFVSGLELLTTRSLLELATSIDRAIKDGTQIIAINLLDGREAAVNATMIASIEPYVGDSWVAR